MDKNIKCKKANNVKRFFKEHWPELLVGTLVVVAVVGGVVYYKHHATAQMKAWHEAAQKVPMKEGRCDYIADRKGNVRTPVCISDITPNTIGDAVQSLIGTNGINPDTQIQAIVCFYNKGVSATTTPLWIV